MFWPWERACFYVDRTTIPKHDGRTAESDEHYLPILPGIDLGMCLYSHAVATSIDYLANLVGDAVCGESVVFVELHSIWSSYGAEVYQANTGVDGTIPCCF